MQASFCGLIKEEKPNKQPPPGLARAKSQRSSARRKRWDLLLQRMRRKGPCHSLKALLNRAPKLLVVWERSAVARAGRTERVSDHPT